MLLLFSPAEASTSEPGHGDYALLDDGNGTHGERYISQMKTSTDEMSKEGEHVLFIPPMNVFV